MGRKKKVSNIIEPDKYFVINANDKDLTPVYLSLPKCPKYELIDGYGEDKRDQFFRRHETPNKLVNLEKRVYRELKEEQESNSNKNSITGAKIVNRFWDILDNEKEYYANEIKWIEKIIWHTVNGYWFFNNGKPTYISPWHYELLNFWHDPGIGYFEYRDRDRKKLLFDYYAYTATETFENLDKDGFAVKEKDGTYKMKELHRRICLGTIKPKNRRSGETNQGLLINWAIIRKTKGGNATIVSKTGGDAKDYWNKIFIPAWQKYPMFLKPIWSGSNNPNNLDLNPPANDYLSEGLSSFYDFTESAGELANDGDKMMSMLLDEQAKAQNKGAKVDVSKRWGVNKQTMMQGRKIHGFCTNPSTVEEMNEGGEVYYGMAEASKFYQRLPIGQTKSGLFRQYAPSQDGWEGFISPWGESVINDPSKELIDDTLAYCKKYNADRGRFTYLDGIGAKKSLQQERDALQREGTPRAKTEYRRLIRKQPMNYAECWSGTMGGLDLPVEIMEKRQAELRIDRQEKRGYFAWKDGKKDSEVIWISDPDGYIEMGFEPMEMCKNNKEHSWVFDPVQQKNIQTYKPKHQAFYTCGVDPHRYDDGLAATTTTARSDGSFTILKMQAQGEDKYRDGVRWDKVVLNCRFRESVDIFNEQVLMACVYYGAMCYPETNVENTWEYFVKRGYKGYLKHDTDEFGKLKPKPGWHVQEGNKIVAFEKAAMYYKLRGHVDVFYEMTKEFLEMNSLKDMNKKDRVASMLAAIMGSESIQGDLHDNHNKSNQGSLISSMLNRGIRKY